jgi:hypothetical protein
LENLTCRPGGGEGGTTYLITAAATGTHRHRQRWQREEPRGEERVHVRRVGEKLPLEPAAATEGVEEGAVWGKLPSPRVDDRMCVPITSPSRPWIRLGRCSCWWTPELLVDRPLAPEG